MTPSTRLAAAGPRCPVALALLLVVATAACGKKGPPLPPFPRVPAAVGAVTPVRAADTVLVSLPVPSANVDGRQPADLARLEIYAITATRAPGTEKDRKLATRIGELPVRPVLPPLPPLPDGSPAPPLPLPPGVDQGTTIVFREELTPEARIPVELPEPKRPGVPLAKPEVAEEEYRERVSGPLVAPAPAEQPRRYYFVVAVSQRGRESLPSTPVAAPLDAAPSAPGAPVVTYTASGLSVTWAPSPDARPATLEPPSPVAAAPPAAAPPANATPANATPAAPVPPALPLLAAKSLGLTPLATTYHLYEVPAEPPAEDPFALAAPVALTPQPLTATEWSLPGVTFGVERCFVTRAVDVVAGVPVLSPPSPMTCETPRDTFPPAAPRSLAAIAGAGVINLIWEPNAEADLGGYLVLRGEAPGATLAALTPSPVRETTFRDTTVRPGVRYVYAVVAVDTADPQNVSPQSNRAEETARQ